MSGRHKTKAGGFWTEAAARHHELDDLTPTIVAIFLQHRRRYRPRRIPDAADTATIEEFVQRC